MKTADNIRSAKRRRFAQIAFIWQNAARSSTAEKWLHSSALRTEDVSRIGYQVLDAMNHCAKLGIMHRDLKSENI
eukprot:4095651-Ditylum_brightwellii.AAC.1